MSPSNVALPFGGIWAPSDTWFLGPPTNPHTKWHLDQLSCFCRASLQQWTKSSLSCDVALKCNAILFYIRWVSCWSQWHWSFGFVYVMLTVTTTHAHMLLLACMPTLPNVLQLAIETIHSTACKYITLISYLVFFSLPSVLWRCRLGLRNSTRPVKMEWWGVDVVFCLERGVDCLHMIQLMPLLSQNPIMSCLI